MEKVRNLSKLEAAAKNGFWRFSALERKVIFLLLVLRLEQRPPFVTLLAGAPRIVLPSLES